MENTSKIVELINKVVCGLNNGDIVAGKYGVEIEEGYSIDSEDTSLKDELCLTISDTISGSGKVMIMSYDYPELKGKMIELRDAIKDSRMRELNRTLIDPFIQALDKKI